jgi:ATP-dependent Clp protease ATP-binding subunit ClpC
LKTSVVRGLALAIADGAVPKILLTKNIYSLDVGTMIENTGVRGALESKVKEILAAAMRTRDILFIDEIHSIVGAGGQGGQDIANQFKPALASGKLSCIGATTLDEYRRYIESDPALERRFSIVQIDEPSVESATQTLVGLSELYGVHHSVVIPKETCSIMAKLASRYMVDRNLPDSAIDVMDISCLNAAKRTSSIGSTTITLREWRDIISSGRFGEAALKKPRYQYGRAEESIVTEEDVQMAVESLSRRTIYISIKDQLKDVEEKLLSVVIGQDDQIREICRLLKSGYLYSSGKTMGGLLLVGRPGTGKTYTGTMIAEAMFDGNILTLGMANYTEAHSASNLIGPPKGYVGYDEGGELTEYVHAHPSCVVMLDNIECAHPNVYDIINGILSSGKLTGSNGRTVDFSGVLILLTSNSGVDVMAPDRKVIGFGGTPTSESSKKKELDKSIGSILPEHVMDRIHSRIVYNNLTEDDIGRIFDLELGKCLSSSRGPRITVTDPAKRHLVSKNWKNGDGARIVQKIISRDVLDLVADRYVSGELGSSDTITVDLIGDSIAITGGELNDVINQKSEMPS